MRWISSLLGVVFLAFGNQAWGQNCAVSSVPIQFGQYNSFDRSPIDAIGSVHVRCSVGTAFTVKLGPGEHAAAGFHPRRMRSATSSQTLIYNLYRDPVRALVWGDGTDNTTVFSDIGTGGKQSVTIYGRLPAGQNVKSGLYHDSIVVTVEW